MPVSARTFQYDHILSINVPLWLPLLRAKTRVGLDHHGRFFSRF
jgi:hypothetical protein